MPGSARLVAEILQNKTRLPVIWLEFQDCTGDTESFLRSNNPTVTSIILELFSLNYHETLMVPAGSLAEKSKLDTIAQFPGQYIAIVEGAIPTGRNGAYCTVGGKSALQIVREVCGQAAATIAVGTCATSGGWPKAVPNPTGAVGVGTAAPGIPNLINMPGCPMNVVNLASVLVQYQSTRTWPQLDSQRRPTFAYGRKMHETCPRKERDEAKYYGDGMHRAGYCLKALGCRGPETFANCHQALWNDKTSWCVAAGHQCIGCTEADFWDRFDPFYRNGG
jgi:hydrogenase small subunit